MSDYDTFKAMLTKAGVNFEVRSPTPPSTQAVITINADRVAVEFIFDNDDGGAFIGMDAWN